MIQARTDTSLISFELHLDTGLNLLIDGEWTRRGEYNQEEVFDTLPQFFERLHILPMSLSKGCWEDDDFVAFRIQADLQSKQPADLLIDEISAWGEANELIRSYGYVGLQKTVERSPRMTRQEALDRFNGVVDGMGLGLDADITDPVAGLTRFGVRTTASCQGHDARALAYPWIDIDAAYQDQAELMLAGLEGFMLKPKGANSITYRILPTDTDGAYSDYQSARERLHQWGEHLLTTDSL
jgi:hypothetical protein